MAKVIIINFVKKLNWGPGIHPQYTGPKAKIVGWNSANVDTNLKLDTLVSLNAYKGRATFWTVQTTPS